MKFWPVRNSLQITLASSGCAILLAFVALDCSVFAGGPFLLLDQDIDVPLTAYAMDGRIVSHDLDDLFCAGLAHPLDVSASGVLQNEGMKQTAVLRTLTLAEVARFPRVPLGVNDVRISPLGESVAVAGTFGYNLASNCRSGVFMARAGGQKWESVCCSPELTEGPSSAAWSFDGSRILFSYRQRVYSILLGKTEPRELMRGQTVRVSPKDGRIAVVDAESVIVIQGEERMVERKVMRVEGLMPRGIEWSNDGARLSIVSKTPEQPGDNRVRTALGVVDVNTWLYRGLGIVLWGDRRLRWIGPDQDILQRLAKLESLACGDNAKDMHLPR